MSDRKIEVAFWGTRGGISTPGRGTEKYGGNTPCISISVGDEIFIFDAGTGIRSLGNHLITTGDLHNKTLRLFLTHTHWDHIQGLPFFVPAYIKGTPLTVYGSPSKGGFLESILRGQMDYDYFPVDLSSLQSDLQIVEMEENAIQFGDITLHWQEQHYHPGGCLRYKIEYGGNSVVFATDVELNMCFGKDYPTDEERQRAQDYLKFVQGCDLLVADGQYTAEQYPTRIGWGHTSMELLMEIAHRSGVKRVAVYHHDPDHTDLMIDEFWNQFAPMYSQARPAMQVFWAREGMSVPV